MILEDICRLILSNNFYFAILFSQSTSSLNITFDFPLQQNTYMNSFLVSFLTLEKLEAISQSFICDKLTSSEFWCGFHQHNLNRYSYCQEIFQICDHLVHINSYCDQIWIVRHIGIVDQDGFQSVELLKIAFLEFMQVSFKILCEENELDPFLVQKIYWSLDYILKIRTTICLVLSCSWWHV